MALTLKFADNDSTRVKCPKLCAVCGGKPPYTFTTTKGSIEVLSASTFQVNPPSNPNPSVVGLAYCYISGFATSAGTRQCVFRGFKCDGTEHTACTGVGVSSCLVSPCDFLAPCSGSCLDSGGSLVAFAITGLAPESCPGPRFSDSCIGLEATKQCQADTRTPQMIADGCNPCPLSLNGAIITVVDADGVVVSRTLTLT